MTNSQDDYQYSPPAGGLTRHITFQGRETAEGEAPTLEGVLHLAQDGMLHPGVVLLHANPAAGGNMDMNVMQALEVELASAGIATLRYNSRGVGNSTGTVSRSGGKRLVAPEGEAEVGDIGAALDFLAGQDAVDSTRLALVGHSFGARISLAYVAARDDERVKAITCIGLPVAWRDLSYLGHWPRPRLFVTGELDDFCPPDDLARYVEGLPEPKTLLTLKNTGHFFEGRERDLAMSVATFLHHVLP
ncbi:MAG: alpha/beta fold hydrolase [Chloroflexota bacterium]|nr:alpha/beta fold hydrolase [Chloroflexota bacterium]MDQ5864776.1 alpha/beta fold hydrolase [Chloroflexota bacterium]